MTLRRLMYPARKIAIRGKRPLDQVVVRAIGKASLLFSVLLIFFCGYFPFDFSFAGNWSETIRSRFDVSRQQFFTAGDVRDNILFFMPLGFALALLTRRHMGIPSTLSDWARLCARVTTALLGGATVSAVVELGQCFLGDRDPSLVDVVNNAIGTALAFSATGILGPLLLPMVTAPLRRAGDFVGWKTLAACSVIWSVGAIVPLQYARDFGELIRWDPTFSVTAGGSANLIRPWRGTVGHILLADRAVSDAEADSLLRVPLDISVAGVFGPEMKSVKTWFDLTRPWPIVDRAGTAPPLEWFGPAYEPEHYLTLVRPAAAPTTRQSRDGIAIDGTQAWLSTDGPATAMIDAIKSASQFTFFTTVATASPWQYGPGRIVTVSDERRGNNFNIGQDRFDLAVRLRARVTAKSGLAPQITVTDVFADTTPQRILVTYRPWHLCIYVNDLLHKSEVTFTPEAALMWQLYPRPMWKFRMGSVGTGFYRPVYRCLAFAPLGVLLAMTVKLAQISIWQRVAIIAAGSIGVCIILEYAGASVGIIGFRIFGPAVCLISAALGAALVRFHEDVSALPDVLQPMFVESQPS